MRIKLNQKPSEHDEQAAFFKLDRYAAGADHRLQNIFAIPNAGKRTIGAYLYYQAEGLEPGVPDVCVCWPSGKYHGAYIEFKKPGAKPTARQALWHDRLKAAGYAVAVLYSADSAWSWLTSYLNGELK